VQTFFKAGFYGFQNSGELFEMVTQQALLEKHMVLQDAAKLGYTAARLFVDIFQQVGSVYGFVFCFFIYSGMVVQDAAEQGYPAAWLFIDTCQPGIARV
jgi:hypothetical protein